MVVFTTCNLRIQRLSIPVALEEAGEGLYSIIKILQQIHIPHPSKPKYFGNHSRISIRFSYYLSLFPKRVMLSAAFSELIYLIH
jgi:hypothetical protein